MLAARRDECWRCGNDELAVGRREVTIGDVNGNALFALGAEAIGDERQIGCVLAQGGAAHQCLQLVVVEGVAVVEEPADKRVSGALAVGERTRYGRE